ncbi:MAG: rhomboid family intramembrane serine protease [Fibrobacterales bacterium]
MAPKSRDHLLLPFQIVTIIWAVFIIDAVLPGTFNHFGILPRTQWGLIGVIASPFLHGSLSHITSNTVPLMILTGVTALFYHRKTFGILLSITIISGLLVWAFGRPSYHIGASSVIFGLIGFLISFGLFHRKFIPLIISALIGLTFGATLLVGILPNQPGVSWEGHLFGAVAGAITARYLAKKS